MTNLQEKTGYISREEKNGLTQEILKHIFDYKEGKLYWKVRMSNRNHIGDLAQWIITDKYKSRYCVTIKSKHYYISRLIFCWHHGYFPEFIDHIDHDTLNNKIENLRAATRIENNRNNKSKKGSSSEYLGVFIVNRPNRLLRYAAQIGINKRSTHIGYFDTEEEAALAYNKMAIKHFGEFANLNIIKEN